MAWPAGRPGTSAALSLWSRDEEPLSQTSLPVSDKPTAGEPGRQIRACRALRGRGSGEQAVQLPGSGLSDLRGCRSHPSSAT